MWRSTPRGTVLGFLAVARTGNFEHAAVYLNTRERGTNAATLAHQLFVVLDRRLPPNLNTLSNDPQGSYSDPLDSRRELVGTIASESGKVDIYLERVDRGKAPAIWLFSRQTLAEIPDLYEEVNAIAIENVLPEPLLHTLFGFTLFGWLFFFVGLPLSYCVLTILDRLLGVVVGYLQRRVRSNPELRNPSLFPAPVRLLIIAISVRLTMVKISLSLLARQVSSIAATIITIVAFVWIAILVNGRCEAYLKRRYELAGRVGAAAVIRPARRVVDLLVIVIGLLVGLHTFGVNPSAALAGLGVGGIAVALAAQKTLENVIGGASLILDEAVRAGDSFKLGDVVGTVEEIGLRSTRVRTLDRTVVTIPNGQIANMILENFSLRDSYWFRHLFGLRYETSSSEMNSVLTGIRTILENDKRVRPESVRVRFLRYGESTLDMEAFAYVSAQDWNHFLEIQEELLLRIKEVIAANGVRMAFPSHTVYLGNDAKTDVPTVAMAAKKGGI